MRDFDAIVGNIRRASVRLGHKRGWRFLYSPRKTFAPKTRLFFIGVNPGGRHRERGSASLERGNAYRVQPWLWSGRLNKLQRQVGQLYDALAAELKVDRDKLMDETLVSNLCPFRCPRWHEMPIKRRNGSIEYSRKLWDFVLRRLRPKVIICIGDLPRRVLREVLEDQGFAAKEKWRRTGWGTIYYSTTTLNRKGRSILLVGLPHLSTVHDLWTRLDRSTLSSFVESHRASASLEKNSASAMGRFSNRFSTISLRNQG